MTTWEYSIRVPEDRFPGYAWLCEVKRDGMLPEVTAWRHENDAKRYIRARIGVDRVTWNLVDHPGRKSGKREVN